MSAQTTQESTLMTNTVLSELNCRAWSFRKFDKEISDELTVSKKAKNGSLRVNKRMLLAEHTKPIEKAFSELRAFFYSRTLPFYDKGARLLCIDGYLDFCKDLNTRFDAIESLLIVFYTNYPSYIAAARDTLLGETFALSDYPSVDAVKSRFECKISFSPVPDGTTLDKLAGMPPDELKKIKSDLLQKERERTTEAMKELWSRLYEGVTKMHERLSKEDNIFRDSLVSNLCELVDILPKMNITNDPDLERMRKEVESALCSTDPQTLRKDMQVRKTTAEGAKKLADNMAAFF